MDAGLIFAIREDGWSKGHGVAGRTEPRAAGTTPAVEPAAAAPRRFTPGRVEGEVVSHLFTNPGFTGILRSSLVGQTCFWTTNREMRHRTCFEFAGRGSAFASRRDRGASPVDTSFCARFRLCQASGSMLAWCFSKGPADHRGPRTSGKRAVRSG